MKQIFTKNSFVFLPLSLAILFVVQNQIFNMSVGLYDNQFIVQFIIATFALGVILYGPSVLFPRLWKYVYLFFISLFTAWLFLAQYFYFSYFGGFMQASALKYAGQTTALTGTILALVSPVIFVFLLQFAVIAYALVLEKKGKIIETKNKKQFSLLLILVGILGYGFVLFGDGNGWNKITNFSQTLHELNSFVYSPNQAVQRTGIFNYYASDAIGLFFRKTKLTPEDVAFVLECKDAVPKIKANNSFGKARGKNLIIIQVESLENSVLFQKINGVEITPNLNKLAKEGLYFDNYYTQVGAGNTADAEFVTLNSMYALTNTVAFIDFAHNKYNALPSLLKQNGYSTYSLHADVPTFWNRSNIYPALGYEKTYSKPDYVIAEKTGFEYMPDKDFFTQSLLKMNEFKSPYLATLITLSSHTPFIIPKEYQTLVLPENTPWNTTQKDYLQSIHYTDSAIGDFIAELKTNGTYKNSLIAIYGDHGNLGGISEVLATSTSKIFPELRTSNVPFIILNSGLPGKTYHFPGSHLDFYPTMTNFLGVRATSTIFGKDLLGTTHRVTLRNPYTRAITAILEETIAYKNFTDEGIFEDGECLKMPKQTKLPITDCQKMYNEEIKATSASDLIIKGNLISKISNS